MIKEGTKVANFELKNHLGETVSLNDFSGLKKVIYFYPKDDTPGCTRQACAFGVSYEAFKALNIPVIGISKDSVASHERFVEKYQLPFILLSDPELTVIKMFDVYQLKKSYGVERMGVVRATFILDEQNTVIKVFPQANPDTNAQDVLAFLKANE